jgi:hypothetical protein
LYFVVESTEHKRSGIAPRPVKQAPAMPAIYPPPLSPAPAAKPKKAYIWDESKGNAALIWGRIMAKGTKAGRPRSAIDMIVAAIAEANDCAVVTDNEKHFTGLKIVNPLRLSAAILNGPPH